MKASIIMMGSGSRLAMALVLAALSPGIDTSGHGEVRIDGTVADVHVTTHDDVVSDVLVALESSFSVHYRTPIRLDAPANATYSGSLRRVIGKLLESYSYVIKEDHESLEVIVVGRIGERAVAGRPPAPVPKKGIVSQWLAPRSREGNPGIRPAAR